MTSRRRPTQKVQIHRIQDRTSRPSAKKPYIVRWLVDGKPHSRSFETEPEAEGLRSRLIVAKRDGERFDRRSGEPVSWASTGEDLQAHLWARMWVAEQWDEWQPRTRTNELEGLIRFIPLLTEARAPKPPKELRGYLRNTLKPHSEVDPNHDCERWLARWVLTLGELNRQNLAVADRDLGKRDDGGQAKSETSRRRRRTAKACVRRAVELDYIPADPWPPTQRGRSRRKVNRVDLAVDVKRLHAPATVVKVIDCIPTRQPGSRRYQLMTATVYYAGMRPSEVKVLVPEVLGLPEAEEGEPDPWGWIDVIQADDGEDNLAGPKTGRRRVPIPPRLVKALRDWIARNNIKPGQMLFVTENGKLPSDTNWSRSLQGAHRRAGVHHIEVYGYRHAAATTWIRNGMSLAEAAARLGDSVETLVAYYINAMEGDEAAGNAAVERALDGTREAVIVDDREAA